MLMISADSGGGDDAVMGIIFLLILIGVIAAVIEGC